MTSSVASKKVHAAAESSDSDEMENVEMLDDEIHMSDEEFPMSDEDDDADEEVGEETKWAATMAKILKQKNVGVLSKAKKIADIELKKEKPAYKFEVAGEKVKKEDDAKPDKLKLATEMLKQKIASSKDRQKNILGLRVRPSISDYERERTLKKVGTKGCVQLFNAVRAQQKDIGRKLQAAGKLESKREKVMKNINKKEFLNALMSGPRAKSEFIDNLVKDEEEEELKDEVKSESDDDDDESVPKSSWNALKPDFLIGKKSGWDKNEDDDQQEDNFDDSKMESDSDSD